MDDIDKQVATYMQGSDFGDSQIKEQMTKELRQRLVEAKKEGRPLRVYCGFDVTAPDIHLGHTIQIRKLKQFQNFGHEVTFVIGTFTTLIGDPSDRDTARDQALEDKVKENAQTYAEQAFKILDKKKTYVRYNNDWLSKLTFKDVIGMAGFFTVQQFLARDRIQKRLESNDPIWLREFLYPLAQGYDAVHLKTDVQIGATEQLFNLMACRRLQEAYGQKPQVCITFPVLVGIDGADRMSKSRGNYIGIDEPAETIYGKTMSIPDGILLQYFELLTDITGEELDDMKKKLESGTNPMDLKKRLAFDITKQYHGEKEAQAAQQHFEKTVQNKEFPDDSLTLVITPELVEKLLIRTIKEIGYVDGISWTPDKKAATWYIKIPILLEEVKFVKSRSEANKLLSQGAISVNGAIIDLKWDPDVTKYGYPFKSGDKIIVGKRRFLGIG